MISSRHRLIHHLPGIYHSSTVVRELLEAVEEVLFFGAADLELQGLEQLMLGMASDYDPRTSSTAFLDWLQRWLALSDGLELSENQRRDLLRRLVPSYSMRGTRTYLEEMLAFFRPSSVRFTIDDKDVAGFVLGKARLGETTVLAAEQPFLFEVVLCSDQAASASGESVAAREREACEQTFRTVIELSKPAHTQYRLRWEEGAKAET